MSRSTSRALRWAGMAAAAVNEVAGMLGRQLTHQEMADTISLSCVGPNCDLSRLYFEAHITVTPHDVLTFNEFRQHLADDTWRVSSFSEDDVDHIGGKWFITCRHDSLEQITALVRGMVERITEWGLEVQRWKIEDTLLDSNHGDTL